MKFGNLIINVTDIEDALVLQQNSLVSAIFSNAEEIIENNGKIIIQREYTNAPPDIIQVYSSLDEVRE